MALMPRMSRGISRRTLLVRGAVGLAGVSLLAACAPSAPATKPAEAPKPTAAPAAPAAITSTIVRTFSNRFMRVTCRPSAVRLGWGAVSA